jgi:large subunit ribosomal protein L18
MTVLAAIILMGCNACSSISGPPDDDAADVVTSQPSAATVLTRSERPRLSVYRSLKHIYGQIIDDSTGKTLVAASTAEKAAKQKNGGNVAAAKLIGEEIAKRALKEGIKEVVFDRGGHRYHGRVKALADAAREAGLKL